MKPAAGGDETREGESDEAEGEQYGNQHDLE